MKFRLYSGEVLEVIWDGNVYVDPCTGAQYTYANEAMRDSLGTFLQSCGEEVDNDDFSDIDLGEYGAWIPDDA
jgi:hypothetical protein